MKRLFVLFIVMALSCGAVFCQKKDAYRVRTVVIDPGHGGAKPGAKGSRSFEKDITLSVAKKFGKLIQDNYPDVKIIYTRTTDVDISLAERARIANRNKADLFISIHANSHPTSSPTGVETFVMGLSESKANLEVAKKENADILLEDDYKTNKDYAGFDPNSDESYIIFSLTQNAYLEKSLNFAQAIQTQYKNNLKTINRGVKQAELFVLYKTAMPSVLTEIGFISNPSEEVFMLSDAGQAKIAICLFNAFMNYKSAEEGCNRIANPVINIKGHTNSAKPAAEPQQVAQAEPEKVTEPEPVVQAKPEPAAEPKPTVKEETKAEAKPEPKPEPKVEEKPAVAATTPQEKPLPQAALPPVQEQQPVAEPAAAPQPEPVVEVRPEPKPEAKVEPKPEPKKAEKVPLQAPQNSAPASATAYYTVQFLTTATVFKAGAPELEGISDFQTFKQGKNIAYTSGRFNTMEEARDYCNNIRQATSFKDAWAYQYKGPAATPAATQQAQPQKQQAPTATTTPKKQAAAAVKGLTYRVQFCTSSKQMKAGDPDLQGISDVHSSPAGNGFVHSAGDYKSRAEAQQRCNTIKRSTKFKDAFVIAIYDGERISLEQAKALEQNNKGK